MVNKMNMIIGITWKMRNMLKLFERNILSNSFCFIWGYGAGDDTPAEASKRAMLLLWSSEEKKLGCIPVEYRSGLAYLNGWYMLVFSHKSVPQANWIVIIAYTPASLFRNNPATQHSHPNTTIP